MFKDSIIKKLKELNINTINQTLKEAESIKPLICLPISVRPPYFFLTIYDESSLDKYIRQKGTIGYIVVNGITTLILYIPNPEQQKRIIPIVNQDVNKNCKFVSILELNNSDKIAIFHKEKKKKEQPLSTPKKTSILDELDELSNKPNNLFYADYARKHPSFYFYKKPLESTTNKFKDYKFFKLYCTLIYLAEKSNVIKHKRTQCHISPKDLISIIPNCLKYNRQKGKSSQPIKKRTYSKSYITFLDNAKESNLIYEYQLKGEYISIIFSESFISELGEPPYTKLPFSLIDEISSYNYRFILYFVIKQFSNNPSQPYFVKIKIKNLLGKADIRLSTSNTMAAERLNTYFRILERYHVIDDLITYVADDIRRNTLIDFRLYHFQTISDDIYDEYEDWEEEE